MFFKIRRDKVGALLRKALRTRNLRDRDVLLAYARELNEIAMDEHGDRRPPVRNERPARPVTRELEAVARRICLAFHTEWRADAPTRWDSLVDDQWPDFLVEAEASLEALLLVAPDPRVRAYVARALGRASAGAARRSDDQRTPAPRA